MQALIEIPESDLNTIDQMRQDSQLSRDQIVQAAISTYIARRKALEESFGAWADRGIDGLEYQIKIREEW